MSGNHHDAADDDDNDDDQDDDDDDDDDDIEGNDGDGDTFSTRTSLPASKTPRVLTSHMSAVFSSKSTPS